MKGTDQESISLHAWEPRLHPSSQSCNSILLSAAGLPRHDKDQPISCMARAPWPPPYHANQRPSACDAAWCLILPSSWTFKESLLYHHDVLTLWEGGARSRHAAFPGQCATHLRLGMEPTGKWNYARSFNDTRGGRVMPFANPSW